MTLRVWSTVNLPDPATYYGGFKEGRVLSWGDINRALSDDRGQYEGADFSFIVADHDNLVRSLMASEVTKYAVRNREVTLRMISDAQRRLLATPRTIARGLTKSIIPTAPYKAQVNCVDFVSSKFAGTNTDRQIPGRLIGQDFVSAPIEVRELAVPIIYGDVSDEASGTAGPPTITGNPALGAYTTDWGTQGYGWASGFGHLFSGAAVPTGVVVTVAPGGAMSIDVQNGEYGILVTAVDAAGNESDPHFYYTDSDFGGTRGSFANTLRAAGYTAFPDGTQKVVVTWSPSVGAVKYRVYSMIYYYGAREGQFIEVPATSPLVAEFTNWPDQATPPTVDNMTPGAQFIYFHSLWVYAVMARMPDGLTALSRETVAVSQPYRRPLRIEWLPVLGAIEYLVVRRAPASGNFDRQWTVPAGTMFFEDDMLDTNVTYLDGGISQPKGSYPTIYIGEHQDYSGAVWSAFLICGHAVKSATPFMNGLRVDPGSYGITWLVPGQPGVIPYTEYFPTSMGVGPDGRYRDINGRRYAIVYVRGPDSETCKAGQLTVNVKGIDTVGDGSGPIITDLLQQYKHFVVNWGFQEYQSGAWLTSPLWEGGLPKIDEDSFDAASAIALQRIPGLGYVGSAVIGNKGEQQTLREWMARWNLSGNVDAGFNRNSQFFVSMLNDNVSALAGALEFTQLHDVLAESLSTTPQPDKHFNVHPYAYRRRWREDVWEVENSEVRDTVSVEGYRDELTAQLLELWFIRDATTANDVMRRRLQLTKDPPLYVTFKTALKGFNTDLGDIILLTHTEGVGQTGWQRQALRILRHALNPNDLTITMECVDVGRVFTGAFILGDDTWAVNWTTATPVRRLYGFLADETTGVFSDLVPGKHLR